MIINAWHPLFYCLTPAYLLTTSDIRSLTKHTILSSELILNLNNWYLRKSASVEGGQLLTSTPIPKLLANLLAYEGRSCCDASMSAFAIGVV